MKTNTRQGDNRHGNPLRAMVWGGAAIVLLLPLIAMQFTPEVDWDAADFLVFGAMLLFLCGGYELATRFTGNRAYHLAAGVALLGAFFLTWANLAVGIIGNENNALNLVFFAIPMVGVIGAVLARFEARGMASAMVATAVAQGLAGLIALIAEGVYTFALTATFVLPWLMSAHLFRKAALEPGTTRDRRLEGDSGSSPE